MQILSNATKGLVLGIVETRKADGKVFPAAGPFQVDVTDPNGTINVVPGTKDQATPTIFRANGSGKTGTVTVKVTDTSNTLVGSASFDVVAPAPPPPVDLPDTLTVDFTAEP
jgi:hypothetical protein